MLSKTLGEEKLLCKKAADICDVNLAHIEHIQIYKLNTALFFHSEYSKVDDNKVLIQKPLSFHRSEGRGRAQLWDINSSTLWHHSPYAIATIIKLEKEWGTTYKGMCWCSLNKSKWKKGQGIPPNLELMNAGNLWRHCFDINPQWIKDQRV